MFLAEKPRGTDADPFPVAGLERRRDPRARLSRHEGVRARLRRLRGEGREPARRRRGPGLQAADGDLRDRRACRRRRAPSAWRRTRSNSASPTPRAASSSASRSSSSRASPASSPGWRSRPWSARQLTWFAARQKDSDKRCDIEAGMAKLLGRPRRLGQRRQRAAGPRRQRLRRGIRHQPRPLRRPHPQHLRGRGGNPGPGDRAGTAEREELTESCLRDLRRDGVYEGTFRTHRRHDVRRNACRD